MSKKAMPNIKLTIDEYIRITDEERFSKGGESIICKTEKNNTLYKFFKNPETGNLIDMPENKEKKITRLYELNPNFAVKPLSTISVGGYLVGYEMTYNPQNRLFKGAPLTRLEKIEILRKSKEALEYFKELNIIYGDVKSNNILINRKTGEIEFCDMDNIQLEDYPIDLITIYVQQFTSKYGKIDNVVDAYIHNILTLQQLGFPNPNPTYIDIIRTIEQGIYPTGFSNQAREIFESMSAPEKFTGDYVIQCVMR